MADESAWSEAVPHRRAWRIRRWLTLGVMAFAPVAVSLYAAWAVVFALPGLGEFGMSVFNDSSAEAGSRLLGAGLVLLAVVAGAALLAVAVLGRAWRRLPRLRSRLVLDVLACNALVAVGAAFAVFDMTFDVADSTELVLFALALGLLGCWPLFLARGRGVRWLLLATTLYGCFAGWIAAQRHIEWNMQRAFIRFHHPIRPGMTRGQIEALMRQEFPGKQPVRQEWADSVIRYTLDPDDGRFNSEFVLIETKQGRVVSADYVPD